MRRSTRPVASTRMRPRSGSPVGAGRSTATRVAAGAEGGSRPRSKPSGSAGGPGAAPEGVTGRSSATGWSGTSERWGTRWPASGRRTRRRRSPTSARASAASTAPGRPGSSSGRAEAARARNRPGPISTPRLSVITSSTSWASSNTTTWWGGSTAPPLARWAPYRWVLTTTTSASAARARASSAKQSRPEGHRKAPGHSRAVVETMAQARAWGSNSSSARSPVTVCWDQSTSRRTCSPSRPRAAPSSSPPARSVVRGSSASGGSPVPGWSESCSPRPPTSETRWRHR